MSGEAEASGGLGGIQGIMRVSLGILAAFPGIAVYATLVEVPPSLVGVAKIISISLTIFVVIALAIFSNRIIAIGRAKLFATTLVLLLIGIATLIGYTRFADSFILTDRWEQGVPETKRIIPLQPTPEIVDLLDDFADESPPVISRRLYETALQGLPPRDAQDLRRAMRNASFWSFTLMVVLLLFSHVLLVGPPVALAWRLLPPTRPAGQAGDGKEGSTEGARSAKEPGPSVRG